MGLTLLELGDPRWRDFVDGHSRSSLFHHPAWAGLLADCYGYSAKILALSGPAGAVSAGFPVIDVSRPLATRRWVSLPFTDYVAPLATGDPGELVSAAREFARERRLGLLEVRAPIGETDANPRFVRHELVLASDSKSGWDRLSTNHRRNIRVAERERVTIHRGVGAAEIDAFYRLHVRTRRRLGVPVQPRRFFALLLERLFGSGLGFVLVAYSGCTPVAAAIFGSWNGTLIYKYGARDERFDQLDANFLLFWDAIRWATENGYRTFDFGRSDVGQTSLRRFKSGWGAVEVPLAYSRIAGAPAIASAGRLERAVGVVIRNSRPWVCRAMGEVLYRYAA